MIGNPGGDGGGFFEVFEGKNCHLMKMRIMKSDQRNGFDKKLSMVP